MPPKKTHRLPYNFNKKKDLIKALLARGKEQKLLFERACRIRDARFGKNVEVRSVIEYSNICGQACNFCGMNVNSGIKRYVLSDEAVLSRVKKLYRHGRRVIMFQTGECHSEAYFKKLYLLLKKIKEVYADLTIIGCFGNLSEKKYKLLRDIGVERYILKFETSDPRLYRKIKPSDTLARRISRVRTLKKLGFQVSSGNIIGLPGQTAASIAGDLLLMKKLDLPMGSTSAFIPNQISNYAAEPPGDLDLALNYTAILRIMCPDMLIPATSSLESLAKGGQYLGLLAGSNTITLHDGTPRDDENRFVIYKLGRYIPKNGLLGVVKKAGLEPSGASLIFDKTENSLYHRLVLKHLKQKSAAVHSEGKKYSYRNIHDMTSRFCSFLLSKGISRGDVIVLALFDSIEFVVAFLSCIRLGITVGAVDPMLKKEEWNAVLNDIQPKCVLCADSVLKNARGRRFLKIARNVSSEYFLSFIKKYPKNRLFVTPDHNNPALILFTSGTTGRPKGVAHTYKDLFVDLFPGTILKMKKNDITYSCSRMHTSFGLGNSLLFPFHFGGGTILSRNIPNPFSVRKILKKRPTLFFAVPSMYSVFLPHAASLRRLFGNVRIFVSSGEKLQTDLFKNWRSAFGKPLLDSYGSTEMCHPFISNAAGKEKTGSVGRVIEGFKVKFGKNGNISYKGPSLFAGYYKDEDLTNKRLKNGWFRSDDMGFRDKAGFIYFKGRDNLVVKSGGKWISFPDIESKLTGSPLIKEIAVSKKDDGLHYFVSLKRRGHTDKAEHKIRELCSKNLALHELPARIHVLDELPRTRSGKVDRGALQTIDCRP